MGYTHYWTVSKISKPKLKQLKRDVKEVLIEGLRKGILGDGNGEPCSIDEMINEERIRFNGLGENSYETFDFWFLRDNSDFTKTNRKPYDKYVVAVLSIIKYYAKDSDSFNSDGGQKVFEEPYEVYCKKMIKEKIKEKIKKV